MVRPLGDGMAYLKLLVLGALAGLLAACLTHVPAEPARVHALNGEWYSTDADEAGTCADGFTRLTVKADGSIVWRTWVSTGSVIPPSARAQVWMFHGIDSRTGSLEFCRRELPDGPADPLCKSKVAARMPDANSIDVYFWTESDLVPPPHGAGGIWRRCPAKDGKAA